MDIRVPTGAHATTRARFPVTIHTISCEGMGLSMRQPSGMSAIVPGTMVVMCFALRERAVELPANIVWFQPNRERPGELSVGIHLRLELAAAATRQAFATWVVGLTTQAGGGGKRY